MVSGREERSIKELSWSSWMGMGSVVQWPELALEVTDR